jgi:cohesin loading factor subunit SCC2
MRHPQVNSLSDDKSAQADSNAAKTMALDHLGVIAARIRSSTLKVQKDVKEGESKYIGLKPLDEVRRNSRSLRFIDSIRGVRL